MQGQTYVCQVLSASIRAVLGGVLNSKSGAEENTAVAPHLRLGRDEAKPSA